MSQEAPFRWPVRLRCRRIRDFSDSFRREILGTSALRSSEKFARGITAPSAGPPLFPPAGVRLGSGR